MNPDHPDPGIQPDAAVRRRERRYNLAVRRHLTRNFLVHLVHGMLGQTGFRLLNAPTFLPAYVLLLSGGSDIAVGIALALQSLGMTLTPLIGANLIEHRQRVLPIAFVVGMAMRLSVLGIALSGLFLNPTAALWLIYFWLLCFGLFQGMQGVMFNFLMSKVIPVSRRGRLTGLRNALAGVTAAMVASIGGQWLIGDTPSASGYSHTFLLAFVLTMLGLAALLLMREPEPPTVRRALSLRHRLREIPALLAEDPTFTQYFLARSLATMGRMALPFYILFAGTSMSLSGTNLAIVTVAFTLAGTLSNLVWGMLADARGFRLAFLAAIGLWVLATVLLLITDGLWFTTLVFIGMGAATQGFQHAAMNLTLEFGSRDDLPVRIAIANSTSELAGTLGPLLGGFIAAHFGYPALFTTSMAFLIAGGVWVAWLVPEPRFRGR